MKTIIEETTQEVYSKEFMLIHDHLPATLIADGLQGDESVTIQYWTGTKFIDYQEQGTKFQLTETNNGISIYSPILIRVHKSATTSPVSVSLISYYIS